MEVLMSNWSNPVEKLPEKYIFLPNKRPGTHVFPVMNNIPIIDLQKLNGHNRAQIIQQIFDASQEFGIFQVINHGIPSSLMEETMKVMKEFFAAPPHHKAMLYSTDITKKCRIYSSTLNYDHEDVHYWRDNLTHHCHPLQEHIHLWPQNPPKYREIVGTYSIEARKVMMMILEVISEGLGLELELVKHEPTYFEGEVSKIQLLSVNHHIPCPDPSLTLRMPQHSDPNLISMLQQCSVPGFQLLRHHQWMSVKPTPDAFLVIPGLQLKVISNGRFLSPIHRVVTHSGEGRTTIGAFLIPSNEIVIEPAMKEIGGGGGGGGGGGVVYRGFTYGEFFSIFTGSKCDADAALEVFKNIKAAESENDEQHS